MAGMLQVITWLLSIYLIVKGVEVLQVGLASSRANRKPMIIIGWLTLAFCFLAAIAFTTLQDEQAAHVSAIASPSGS